MMKNVKYKISKQLFSKFILLLFFSVLMAIAGIICINVLKRSSGKIVFEYEELDAIHNFRKSFHDTFIPAYNYFIYHDGKDLKAFEVKLDSARSSLTYCHKLLDKFHNKQLLNNLYDYVNNFEHVITNASKIDLNYFRRKELIDQLEAMLLKADTEIEILLNETKYEIDKYVKTNKAASGHSTLTIIILSTLITISGFFFIHRFIEKITSPLRKLVNVTQQIGQGDLSVKTRIKTNDEFEILGDSFDIMVENLKEITISKNYFNNILRSMFDSLIVTDNKGFITMVNQATVKLLEYEENNMIGRFICDIIFSKENEPVKFNYYHWLCFLP